MHINSFRCQQNVPVDTPSMVVTVPLVEDRELVHVISFDDLNCSWYGSGTLLLIVGPPAGVSMYDNSEGVSLDSRGYRN